MCFFKGLLLIRFDVYVVFGRENLSGKDIDYMEQKKCTPTSIGGQAVIEGIMMKGPTCMATAIRKADGSILVDKKESKSFIKKLKLNKIPILRGFLAFFESMFTGVKCLMFSAKECDLEEDTEQMSKFEKWLMEKFGDKLFDIFMYISVFVSLLLGIGLFMILPKLTVEWVSSLAGTQVHEGISVLIEGCIRMILFVCYMLLISRMKDIQRVFQYHGAEHKTIFAYEYGDELTVENVKKHTRFHPRCGTSFLVLVMIVSIIVFFFFVPPADNVWMKILWRIALLPVVAGISYELIKFAGKCNNAFTRMLSKPGVWLQHLTTKEPDDSMIEVAIEALKAVLPSDSSESTKW